MTENPYQVTSVARNAEFEGPSRASRRLQCMLTFGFIGLISGILSGYLWQASQIGQHAPGTLFGIGLAIASMIFAREFRGLLAVLLIVASYAGFYLATAIWTESGLPATLERIAMLVVGLTPIATVYALALRDMALSRFAASLLTATMIGGAGFLYFSNLRGQLSVYGFESIIGQSVFEALRFASWQVCVATAIGFTLPLRMKPIAA